MKQPEYTNGDVMDALKELAKDLELLRAHNEHIKKFMFSIYQRPRDPLVTTSDLAAALGVTRRTVERWMKLGMPRMRAVVHRVSDVVAWCDARRKR